MVPFCSAHCIYKLSTLIAGLTFKVCKIQCTAYFPEKKVSILIKTYKLQAKMSLISDGFLSNQMTDHG